MISSLYIVAGRSGGGLGGQMSEAMFGLLLDVMIGLNGVMNELYYMSQILWAHPIMNSIVNFSMQINLIVVGAATVILIMDVVEEAGKARNIEFSVVATNLFKGIAFAIIAPQLVKYIFLWSTELMADFSVGPSDIVAGGFEAVISEGWEELWGVLPDLVTFIGGIVFQIMTFLRMGAGLIIAMSSVFYIPDIVRGETSSMGSWIRLAVANTSGFIFQGLFYYLGVMFITMGGAAIVIGFACFAAMALSNKYLSKWGMSVGTAGVVSGVASAAQTGFRMASGAF